MTTVRTYTTSVGDSELKMNCISVRVEHVLNLNEMVDGLCSKYIRNRTTDDEPLPDRLSAQQILKDVKGEYGHRGTSTVWTWAEQTGVDTDEAHEWAEGIIVAAFPKMLEHQ